MLSRFRRARLARVVESLAVPVRSPFSWALSFLLLGIPCFGIASCRETTRGSGAPPASFEADASHAYPLRLKDDLGRIVVLKAEPQRVITLMPSHTEIVHALGAGPRLVGVDDYSNEPAAVRTLPKLGGLYDAHLEEIVSLRPDLVILSDSNSALLPLERTGATVWAGSAKGYDDVFRIMRAIGDLLGRRAQAEDLCSHAQAELAALAEIARRAPPVTVYFEVDATPHAAAPSSFIGRLLAEAGGIDIVPDGQGEFPEISPELVIAKNPAVLFGMSPEEARRRPGWSSIEGVRTGRVYALSAEETDVVVRPGPRLPQGLRTLLHRMHPTMSVPVP